MEQLSAPSSPRCDVTAIGASGSFPAAGGTGTAQVSANRDCTWRVQSDASWLVPQETSGQGQATVTFRVAANGASTSRHAALAIEGVRVEVTQEGIPCRFVVAPTTIAADSRGGSVSFDVSTAADCSWTARSSTSWIAVTKNGSGAGHADVELLIAANGGPGRTGTVSIGDQSVAIVQEAPSPAVPSTPSPSPGPAPSPGSSPAPTPSPSPAPAPAPAPTPTPAPTPAPSPAPAPPPPPAPPPTAVELEDTPSATSGHCPEIAFVLEGLTVYADGSTKYKGGKCKDVDNDAVVKVSGERESVTRVRATEIDVKKQK